MAVPMISVIPLLSEKWVNCLRKNFAILLASNYLGPNLKRPPITNFLGPCHRSREPIAMLGLVVPVKSGITGVVRGYILTFAAPFYKEPAALKSLRASVTRVDMVFSPSRTQTLGSYFFLLGLLGPSGLPTWVLR
jgi:hypothetical protein